MASAERVERIYNRQARRYDAAVRSPTLDHLRADLFALAGGDVLELGVGTGATFAHYPSNLHSLTALDVSAEMLHAARAKASRLPFPTRLAQHDFQTLPFPDASFETVTTSLALCGIPDPPALFAEVRRVLRPGGRLLAVEHVRPPHAVLALLSDLLAPAFDHVVGCHPNRPTPRLLREAGFGVDLRQRRMAGILVALIATPN